MPNETHLTPPRYKMSDFFSSLLEDFYRDTGRLPEIVLIYKRALEIQEKYDGPLNNSVSETLLGLASVYEELEKFEEAVPLYQRALEIMETNLGSDAVNTRMATERFANMLQKMGRTEEAN